MTYLEAHRKLKDKLVSTDPVFLKLINNINKDLCETVSVHNLTDKIITEVSKGPLYKEDFQALLIGLIALGVLLDRETQSDDSFRKFMETLDAAETNE